jgi:O-antigen/teichoic acid export membrane protein
VKRTSLIKKLRDLLAHPYARLAKNASWLIVDKVVRLLFGMAVGIFVARYLGAARYGVLQYASALMSFTGLLVFMGLHGIIVRDIVRSPRRRHTVLGTTLILKLAGGIVGYVLVSLFALLFSKRGGEEFWSILIVCSALLLKPFEVFDYWFESQVQARYSATRRIIASVVLNLARIFLLAVKAPLIAFAAMSFLEAAVSGTMVFLLYTWTQRDLRKWKFSWDLALRLLRQSWPLMLSGIMVTINLKVDQLMLRWMKGATAVGIYGVAVLFSETWYFISDAIVTTVYPGLIKAKKADPADYARKLQRVYDLLFLLALTVAIGTQFFGPSLLQLFYGEKFRGAEAILVIHIWAGLFAFMRALSSKWLLVEDMLTFSFLSNGGGALVNILLNLVLIPRYGGIGAAMATLVSYATSGYFIMFLWKKTRGAARMMSLSLISPARYFLVAVRRVFRRRPPTGGVPASGADKQRRARG